MQARSVNNTSLQVWDPKKEPNLFCWLRELGTDGVICSDTPSPYEEAVINEGMWIEWKQEGEVQVVVEHWIQTRLESPPAPRTELPVEEEIFLPLKTSVAS